jgi:hypothetical protein
MQLLPGSSESHEHLKAELYCRAGVARLDPKAPELRRGARVARFGLGSACALGERLRATQRSGPLPAAIGVVLVTV